MNSYILSPLNVTLHPIAIPSLTLKFATDFLALQITAFCPEIFSRSAIAESRTFALSFASPTPILITILSSFGTSMIFLYPNFLIIASTISFWYSSFNLATFILLLSALNRLLFRLPWQRGPSCRPLLQSRLLWPCRQRAALRWRCRWGFPCEQCRRSGWSGSAWYAWLPYCSPRPEPCSSWY